MLFAVAGCAAPSAVATFRGITTPVLLGPCDRVASPQSAAQPASKLAFTKVKDFGVSAFDVRAETQYSISTTNTREGRMQVIAFRAVGDDPSLDIRVGRLNAFSKANAFGHRVEANVIGEVVRVGGAQ